MQRSPTEEHALKSDRGLEAVEMARSKVVPKPYVSSKSPIPPDSSKEVCLSNRVHGTYESSPAEP